ncbi:hypothetical protein [Methanimicrococcus hongohii]|uniref:hypothetical protein n=1 Tax=Methanimicrococcus hongohii TaxID=3028295 RepID=UPI00292CB0BC|nr:hypothetical protein [Methanimicrococcus sp. Hf6]
MRASPVCSWSVVFVCSWSVVFVCSWSVVFVCSWREVFVCSWREVFIEKSLTRFFAVRLRSKPAPLTREPHNFQKRNRINKSRVSKTNS